MKNLYLLLWTALATALAGSLTAQTIVSVNATSVRNDVREVPFGLNMNTYTDGDGNRPGGALTLREGLSTTRMNRYLRFPGGEKSDVYTWAAGPDYNDPTTSGLARTSVYDWPAADPSIWDQAAGTWANDDYNFDEFMADCQSLGATPVINVAMDGIYKAAQPGDTSLTYQQALDMAVAWVRYANVTHGYGIKYWLLGNETYSLAYNGGTTNPAQYGRDVAVFAQAMKAVDPNILIGINGNNTNYFKGTLAECVAHVDFLDVHAYPCYGFDEYEDYRTRNINPRGIVGQAKSAIDAQATTHKNRLFITMTETSAFGYAGGEWGQGNNIGQALANADIFGQLAGDGRVRFTQFWNTRWVKEDTGISNGEDFLTAQNELNASGRLLTHLADELLDKMVKTTSSGMVRTFATRSADGQYLTVFVLNKSRNAGAVRLNLENFTPADTVRLSEFYGDGVTDHNPTYADLPELTPSGSAVNFTASPLSMTILRFQRYVEPPAVCTDVVPLNHDFETGDLSGWEADYDGVNSWINISNSNNSGWSRPGNYASAGGGKAELRQTITNLLPNTDYIVTGVVNYWSGVSGNPPAYLGVRGHGSSETKKAFSFTNWAWTPLSVSFTTGPNVTQATIFLAVDAGNTWVWFDDAAVTCTEQAAQSQQLHPSANSTIQAPSLVAHPNPTTGVVELSAIPPGRSYLVTNLQGQVVRSGKLTSSRLNLRDLRAGVYHLRVEGYETPLRVVKQ